MNHLNLAIDELLWDIFWTVIECCMICYLGRGFLQKKLPLRYDVAFVAIMTVLTEAMTFLNIHTFIRFPISFLLTAVAFKLIYKLEFWTGCMVYACFGIAQVLAELNVTALVNLFDLQFLNDGNSPIYYLAYLYVPVHLLSALFVLFQRKILMDIKNVLSPKLACGIAFVMLVGIYLFLLISMNLSAFSGIYKVVVALASLLIVAIVFLGLKFFVTSVMTRVAKQQEELRIKDEERVRSVYHDMKNHLLVLESKPNTDETRQMAQELRTQIADYEDYVRTGNEFLDIIMKDKAEKAREKHIDFSVAIDFKDIDFIEPLDISTRTAGHQHPVWQRDRQCD